MLLLLLGVRKTSFLLLWERSATSCLGEKRKRSGADDGNKKKDELNIPFSYLFGKCWMNVGRALMKGGVRRCGSCLRM